MQHVYGTALRYELMDYDIPVVARFPVNPGFLTTDKLQLAETLRKQAIWEALQGDGGDAAVDKYYLTTNDCIPEAILVTSERKLARMGGVVQGGYFPLLRGPTARLFESFNLGPQVRLVEIPVYEPDPSQNGTVKSGPYRLRERADEGAWLSLIVTGKRDTISDAHCHPKALLSDSPRNKNGTLWEPKFIEPGGKVFKPGLAFKPDAATGPHIWHELRVSQYLWYLSPELGEKFAELAVEYPTSKRVKFIDVLKYPVVGA